LSYIENSYVWHLGRMGPHMVNNLWFYDFVTGYTFNIAELSVKKDPSDRYPFGFGLVTTAGIDSKKTMRSASSGTAMTHTEAALEAVAHTFAEEIAQLQALLHSACREVHGEAEAQALTARLVAGFIVGEPGSSHTARKRHTGA
jgi:hypothetical protein